MPLDALQLYQEFRGNLAGIMGLCSVPASWKRHRKIGSSSEVVRKCLHPSRMPAITDNVSRLAGISSGCALSQAGTSIEKTLSGSASSPDYPSQVQQHRARMAL